MFIWNETLVNIISSETACPSKCKDGTCDQSSGACYCEDGYYAADCSKGKK